MVLSDYKQDVYWLGEIDKLIAAKPKMNMEATTIIITPIIYGWIRKRLKNGGYRGYIIKIDKNLSKNTMLLSDDPLYQDLKKVYEITDIKDPKISITKDADNKFIISSE